MQRELGIGEQIICDRTMRRCDRNTHARADEQLVTIEVKLPGEAVLNGLHDAGRDQGIAAILKEEDKIVFAQPIDTGLIRHGCQPSRDFLQKSVTNGMTKGVVDVPEPVQVERRERHRTGKIAGAFL